MIFNKKDGTMRENYKDACELILNSKPHRTEIMRGRSEEVVETYNCYRINFPYSLSNKRKRYYEEKIKILCNEFGCETRTWYSLGINSMDILSDNIDVLINCIKNSMKA